MPLEVVRTSAELRVRVRQERARGQRIALVPTMGYLHEGHLSLLREARKRSDLVVMSLFVNPTQFSEGEDLERYPRDHDGDLRKAESCGVDLVFLPDARDMYPPGFQTRVELRDISSPLCGVSRPEHFAAVATVVCKLFHAALPDLAVFGEKDYQQLAMIRQMVSDLDFGIDIASVPIVREDDGLAMSSRNVYLSPAERKQAPALHKGLQAARQRFEEGALDAATLLAAARAVIGAVPLARIDYLELRDAVTLRELRHVDRPALLATAVRFGRTRLIDNLVLRPSGE